MVQPFLIPFRNTRIEIHRHPPYMRILVNVFRNWKELANFCFASG